jgi:hypothetical protein
VLRFDNCGAKAGSRQRDGGSEPVRSCADYKSFPNMSNRPIPTSP